MKIEYHVDDYGMFRESSLRIIDCINNGKVNAISLMANSPNLEECMGLLKTECKKDVLLSMHLNIMTERPLCIPEEIPDLTDAEGFFNVTYGKLIKALVFPSLRKRYRTQIKTELSAQIERLLPYFREQGSVRIDSHRHFHMVPLVFGVISEIAKERALDISYIRIINDKPALYRGIGRFEHFKPLNIIKLILLKSFSFIDSLLYPDLYKKGDLDFGCILFSGCMTKKNLGIVLKNAEKNPSVFKRGLELMFHPGAVLEEEDLNAIHDPEDREYMQEGLRSLEAEALKS